MSHLDIFNVLQNSSGNAVRQEAVYNEIIAPKFQKYYHGGVYTFFNLYLLIISGKTYAAELK